MVNPKSYLFFTPSPQYFSSSLLHLARPTAGRPATRTKTAGPTNPTTLLVRPPHLHAIPHTPSSFLPFTRRHPSGRRGSRRGEGAESVAGGSGPQRRDRDVATPALQHCPELPRARQSLAPRQRRGILDQVSSTVSKNFFLPRKNHLGFQVCLLEI